MADRADRLAKAQRLSCELCDDDILTAINTFLRTKWQKANFGLPNKNPILWIKFANKHGFERIEMEARNQQYIFDTVERFYQKDTKEQLRLLATAGIYKDEQTRPPRVRIPKLFRVVRTAEFRALVMEFVPGQTLDSLMRLKYNATGESFYWYPTPYSYDLSLFEEHLHDYANAIGVLLSLPVPDNAAPGPVGGGYSNHPIFENWSTEENRAPVMYTSVEELTKHINKLVLSRLPSKAKLADFSNEPLCYVLSDLNNGNVIFYNKEIFLIDHLDAGIMPLSFMTIVADLGRNISKHLVKHLNLPRDNQDALTYVQGAFWPSSDDEDDEING
ncbi:kinase domain-containing protein [Sclerotinia borealis F-4128]|uniref:Kinase domain-containing protein n=1 Tax=Sclerotinia borealis (strain F-4128) TaxID=1432307 RepID=W9C2B7_SCLBF|nr:kinase domain-containing protein [Sclerotinia borealis F-4128]